MTSVELERRRRIRVALAAWAYERYSDSIMTDAEFDKLARQIEPHIATGHAKLDRFFRTEFNASTGQWIYKHPELAAVDATLRRVWPGVGEGFEGDEEEPEDFDFDSPTESDLDFG